MAAPIRQSQYADLLRAELVATDARLQGLAGTLGERALSWVPAAGGWSVGQVLEHLIVAADSYLTPMRRLISERSAAIVGGGDPTWRPSLMGGLLASSLRSPRKLPAPRAYIPAPVPRPDVLEQLRARLRDTALLLDRARPLEWNRMRLSSPISRLIRLNLGDCFAISVAHAHRHVGQIDRIRSQAGFPLTA
ncbi:MAG TPA: DinB family protein [Gemmatimonadales bacterium]|nr:DinB family protein [Gemmatimonadales bacterium]